MFIVKSKLKVNGDRTYEAYDRPNGELGPFEKRETAERALVALCQAGQATSGEIQQDGVPSLTREQNEVLQKVLRRVLDEQASVQASLKDPHTHGCIVQNVIEGIEAAL